MRAGFLPDRSFLCRPVFLLDKFELRPIFCLNDFVRTPIHPIFATRQQND
jgi:hypothetical protein